MATNILDGRALAQELRRETVSRITDLTIPLGRAPTLGVIQGRISLRPVTFVRLRSSVKLLGPPFASRCSLPIPLRKISCPRLQP